MSVRSSVYILGSCQLKALTIGMSRAVNMSIVPGWSFVFDMSRVNGDPTGLLFRRFVDLTVVREFSSTRSGQNFCNGRRQRGFTMVNMAWWTLSRLETFRMQTGERTNGANVHVRFCPRECLSITSFSD